MPSRTKQILYIATLFILLLLPVWYALFTAIDLEYSWLKRVAYLIVVIILLLLPASFLKARTYFFIEGVFNFLFFPIEIASLYLNKQSTSTAFLQNIINTDSHEALELIVSVWPMCVVVVFLWIAYFLIATRVSNEYLFSHRVRISILCSLGLCLIAGWIAMIRLQRSVYRDKPTSIVIKDATDAMWIKLYKIYPFNLYVETIDILWANHRQNELQKEIECFSFGIHQQIKETSALYVLVIGEAARYDHFALNGYERNTTPLLSQTANIVSYDSAFSQANLTSYSVPLIITRATAENPEVAYKEKSLPEAFQEAGYKSGFLTTQTPSRLTTRIMDACNYAFYNAKNIDIDGNYDIELLNHLSEYKQDSVQFFTLHTLGCHLRYEQRYPKEMAMFQPVLGNSFSYSMISEENKDKLINAYDNAILYTDFFLNQLIHYMDSLNRPAVMLYMSDHGESFWDDDRKLSLHGSYQLSKYEYHVPLIVWYSDEYAEMHPEKVTALLQNKNTPVSSDVIFYSLLDIANIGDIVDSTRSICSPALLPYDTIFVHTGSGDVEKMVIR